MAGSRNRCANHITGERGELRAADWFLEQGNRIAWPFGDNCPYDFIVDDGARLYRVQVKARAVDTSSHVRIEKGKRGRGKGQKYRNIHWDRIDLLVVLWGDDLYALTPNCGVKASFTPKEERRLHAVWHGLTQGEERET